MSYCPIYKAASTTWLHQLLILAGRTEQSIKSTKKQLSEQARAIYPVQDSDQVEEVSFPRAFRQIGSWQRLRLLRSEI
jgi:hypothetical protein